MKRILVCTLLLTVIAGTAWGHHDIFGPVSAGDVEKVKYILGEEPELVNVKSKGGLRPLHVAVIKEELETARVLIDGGADVHAVDRSGNTCLHLAAVSGDMGMIRMLLNVGADRAAQNYRKQTPLDICGPQCGPEVKDLLR